MSTEPSRSGHCCLMMGFVVFLVGLNLRPILASIGPLLADIQSGTGLTSAQVSLLTTLPILVMGLFALASARLQRLIGEPRGIALGLSIIAVACAVRWFFNGSIGLILTAALGGIGIALIQALMPSYLKTNHANQTGRLMGLFTTGIMAGAAIAASSSANAMRRKKWWRDQRR